MTWITIVGIDDVARRTSRGAVVAGLVVRAEEPGERIVEAGLVNIDERYGDACTGARATIGLPYVGAPWLLESLDLAGNIGHACLREQVRDVAPATLEDAENIGGLYRKQTNGMIPCRLV